MSELADITDASLSRLSHLIKRLEFRGLAWREPDPADCRYTNAILTEAGLRLPVASAPGPRRLLVRGQRLRRARGCKGRAG